MSTDVPVCRTTAVPASPGDGTRPPAPPVRQAPRQTGQATRGTTTTQSAHPSVEVAVPGQLLVLRGRLDVRVTADVRLALAAAVSGGTGDLVLDVAGVDAVDATGLGVLVGAHRRAGRVGRTLVLGDVPPSLARVLLLTRLDRVLRTTRTGAVV